MLPIEVGGETVDAMIYIMNERFPYNRPSPSYYLIILGGYKDHGFDPKVLDAFLAESLKDGVKSADEPAASAIEDSTVLTTSMAKVLTPTIRGQIMAIRDSREVNMLDTRAVQRIADREGYYELVVYLEEHSKEYWNFIMTGEES